MLLVVAVVGIEDIGELSSLVFCMHNLYHRLLELSTRKLALQLFDLLAGLVVEWVEQLLFQPSLPRTIVRRISHVWAVRWQMGSVACDRDNWGLTRG